MAPTSTADLQSHHGIGGRPFQRARLHVSQKPAGTSVDARTLPELIEYNNRWNPDHLFALQEVRSQGQFRELIPLRFRELHAATLACARLLTKALPNTHAAEQDAGSRPVALFMESDLTLFVYLAALLYLDIPVLLISVRLSPAAITHLLHECSAQAIVVSPSSENVAQQALSRYKQSNHPHPPAQILRTDCQNLLRQWGSIIEGAPTTPAPDRVGALILHSSGTTGLPKPIRLAHRYVLGYAACHQLTPRQCEGRINVSTLPLYHGFGLLAPCLSLSTGKTCCFVAGTTIPSAPSVAELIRRCGATSLMTVPTILEDFLSDNGQWLPSLVDLDFVAVGGGAIKPTVGDHLASSGVSLLNHYGATEIGAIAHIFCPDDDPNDDYDWHYLRLRSDLDLKLQEIESKGPHGQPQFQLSGHPFGWDSRFLIQDVLEKRPTASATTEVKILGRQDDLVVLSTGEKLQPQALEDSVLATGRAKSAIVFGQHRPEIGVMVEPMEKLHDEPESQAFLDCMWSVIESKNTHLDRHARVSSPGMVLLKPADKAVPRSDKGSVMRKAAYETFSDEIEEAYAANSRVEKQQERWTLSPEQGSLEKDLRRLIQSCVQDRVSNLAAWGDDDDFFARGMDSLEATRIARTMSHIHNKDDFPLLHQGDVKPTLIYQNPTIHTLAQALRLDRPHSRDEVWVERIMSELADQFSPSVAHEASSSPSKATVMLTGSTGHLGVHLLQELCSNPNVQQVICLNRSRKQNADPSQESTVEADLRSRQEEANLTRGMALSEACLSKVRFLPSNQLHEQRFGLPEEEYQQLSREVTHIVHNAWPMDFQRTVQSFLPQMQAVRNLLDFSLDCHRSRQNSTSSTFKPQLLFMSSIAVAARYSSGPVVPESPLEPGSPAGFGYPQAKWVCERIMQSYFSEYGSQVQPIIVRLGQLAGAACSSVWNSNEHFPAILRASQKVGALPMLENTYSWIPIDLAAKSVLDILFSTEATNGVYHVENPIRQPWKSLLPVLSSKLGLKAPDPLPFDEWLELTTSVIHEDVITHLKPFLQTDFRRLSSGGVILDTTESRKVSTSLRACNGVGLDLLDGYIGYWREMGVLE